MFEYRDLKNTDLESIHKTFFDAFMEIIINKLKMCREFKMKKNINLVTIWTDKIEDMKNFYSNVLGFEIINDLGDYVEFYNEGCRFAICKRAVMFGTSEAFKEEPRGQILELAFPCESVEDLETSYKNIISKGAVAVQGPSNMPWNQRTAFFKDPDGNIHELFTELN